MKKLIRYCFVLFCCVLVMSCGEALYAEEVSGVLAITEVMGRNSKTLDEDGDSPDWIEIHNGTDKKIDLDGFGLSDEIGDLHKWIFPAREIKPNEYLLVFASKKDRNPEDGELHTNFKLSEKDRGIYFSDARGSLVSYMDVDKFPKDISCGKNAESGRIEYFPQPTPGKANITPAFSPVVKYSLKGGLYQTPVSVELFTGVDATIYYTTDGSTPTEASEVYTAPILVDKNLTIRAVSLQEGHLLSPPSGSTYFIDFDNKGMPIIAIATEYHKLWDPKKGLFREVEYTDNMIRDILRVHVSYFDENGRPGFSQDAKMSVCGAGSREVMMRPLKFTAHETVDPLNSRFKYSLFNENVEAHRHFQIRNNNQDGTRYAEIDECMPTMGIRNALFCKLFYGQEGIEMRKDNGPALFFINGENQGMMNISEKRDNTGIEENNPEIDSKDIDLVVLRDDMGFRFGRAVMEKGKPFIRPDGKVLYKGYFMDGAVEYEEVSESARKKGSMAAVDDFIEMDFKDPTMLDPGRFIATMAAHIISCNTDFGINNVSFYRVAPVGEEPGPFRIYSFDFDSVFGVEKWMEDYDTFLRYEERTNYFSQFFEKEEYRMALVRKIDEFLNGILKPEKTIQIVDELEEKMSPWIQHHLDLWANGTMDKAKWERNIESLRRYLLVRPKHMRSMVRNRFGFDGYSEVEFSVTPANTGEIYTDTGIHEILLSGRGTYAKIPMKLFTKPAKGYRFSHYLINGEKVSDENITLDLEDSMKIEAVFADDRYSPVADLCINEVVRSGYLKMKDEDGDKADWVEIYNSTQNTIDLDGMYLTDNEEKLMKWEFPDVSIDGGGFLVVLLSGKDRANPNRILHASFKLSDEPVLLVAADGQTVIDKIDLETMVNLPDDSCGARVPDGSILFEACETATPGMTNGELEERM